MENAVQVQGLYKQYAGFALRDVHLTVPAGSIVGFVGENGAGKTTTLKAILGLVQPDAGQIEVLGGPAGAVAAKQEIGVVFEDAYFYESLCAREIDKILGRIHPAWDSAQFAQLCRRFSLPEEKPLKDFSRGMRMKLSLASALAHQPRLLVLDEATSGLDPVVRGEMLDLFLDFIQDEKHSILMSSHITSDLEKVADYIVFIHAGQILFEENKDDLLQKYGLLHCSAAQLQALPPSLVVRRRSGSFGCEALVKHPAEVRRLLPGAVCDAANIDDIMQAYAGRNEQ